QRGQPLAHQGEVLAAAFNSEGRTVATASADQTVRLWDVKSGEQISLPMLPRETVTAVAFSPDGRYLLTVLGHRQEIRACLWDIPPAKLLGPALAAQPIHDLVFSPDGRTIIVATRQHVQRWEYLVEPLAGEPGRIALWSEVVTRRNLDAGNVPGWLSQPRWQERFQDLQHGEPLAPAPDRLGRHPRAGGGCLQGGCSAAALWHPEHPLAAEPRQWRPS